MNDSKYLNNHFFPISQTPISPKTPIQASARDEGKANKNEDIGILYSWSMSLVPGWSLGFHRILLLVDRLGQTWKTLKMRVHLKNSEISWFLIKFLEKWCGPQVLDFLSLAKGWNNAAFSKLLKQAAKADFILLYCRKGKCLFKWISLSFQFLILKNLRLFEKMMRKYPRIYYKTVKNPGICHSKKAANVWLISSRLHVWWNTILWPCTKSECQNLPGYLNMAKVPIYPPPPPPPTPSPPPPRRK